MNAKSSSVLRVVPVERHRDGPAQEVRSVRAGRRGKCTERPSPLGFQAERPRHRRISPPILASFPRSLRDGWPRWGGDAVRWAGPARLPSPRRAPTSPHRERAKPRRRCLAAMPIEFASWHLSAPARAQRGSHPSPGVACGQRSAPVAARQCIFAPNCCPYSPMLSASRAGESEAVRGRLRASGRPAGGRRPVAVLLRPASAQMHG